MMKRVDTLHTEMDAAAAAAAVNETVLRGCCSLQPGVLLTAVTV